MRIEKVLREIGEGKLGVQTPVSGRDEIAELAHGVNAMSARLIEVDEMKKTFVASVTHELRSPLGVIESYVKILLSSQTQLDAQGRSSLEKIGASAERLSHFVTNLLDMAKIERGKLDFSPRPSDIASVVEDTVSFFKPRAEELGIRLGCDSEKGLPPLSMDPDLIAHVLTNLLSNALKFTRPGGAVSVELKRLNGNIECAVRDTGVGIPSEAVVRIFTPFERVKNPLRSTGVGLGLAISKSIVELHGGDIGVTSVPQEGSRFYFNLPVKTS
jgi:two-component system phosphate regulon sensor histidine kinase PhoR